jgi:hypothetical protein
LRGIDAVSLAPVILNAMANARRSPGQGRVAKRGTTPRRGALPAGLGKRPLRIPRELAWLFPEVPIAKLDVNRDARFILARVLERGRMADVEWCLRSYGRDGIRRFFAERTHSEISARTRRFWRVVLGAREDEWPAPPAFRSSSGPPYASNRWYAP